MKTPAPTIALMPRQAAAIAYQSWLDSPGRIEPIAAKWLDRAIWDQRDRGLFMELLYGVVRRHGQLEFLLKELSEQRRLPENNLVQAILAVGLYQLLFLDRIPAFAVVDEAVEQVTKAAGSGLGGWANAILRRVSSEPDSYLALAPKGSFAAQLAMQFAHPQWMVERWAKFLPSDQLRAFLIHNNRRPNVTIRVNRLKTDVDSALKRLEEQGYAAQRSPVDKWFIKLEGSGDPARLSLLTDGEVSVQDVSQGLVVGLVQPKPAMEILDLCAAPGGKLGHSAELFPDARITAADKSEERLDLVRDMIRRNGYENVEAAQFNEVLQRRQEWDVVLVDAPCTGTGVLARRPDLRWRRKPDEPRRMAAVQLQLLKYASERVKPGGAIVYSTCSVEAEENQMLAAEFLKHNRRFRISPAANADQCPGLKPDGTLSLLGHEIDGDGVFACRLEKSI